MNEMNFASFDLNLLRVFDPLMRDWRWHLSTLLMPSLFAGTRSMARNIILRFLDSARGDVALLRGCHRRHTRSTATSNT